jgi:hypothetical protein
MIQLGRVNKARKWPRACVRDADHLNVLINGHPSVIAPQCFISARLREGIEKCAGNSHTTLYDDLYELWSSVYNSDSAKRASKRLPRDCGEETSGYVGTLRNPSSN